VEYRTRIGSVPDPKVLGILDPDPLVRSTDPDPDLPSSSKKIRKTFISAVF
jgi:hypothetical protein